MNKKNIVIIGGHGLMGQLFIRLFNGVGHNAFPIGRDDWQTAPGVLAQADWVIICVPINATTETIINVVKYISNDCVLSDFTSIKLDPLMVMLREYSGPVLGLHPMFGPTIASTKNQVIVSCDGRYPEKSVWILELLANLGFTIKPMEATLHDQAMSFIQGIEHFLTFSLGTFLQHKNQHPEKLMEMASPIYLAKLLLMGRIFDQDAALYADIIMADKSRIKLIKEFSQWLNYWVDELEKSNKQDFIKEFENARNWMGKFTSYSQEVSDTFLNIQLNESIEAKHINT